MKKIFYRLIFVTILISMTGCVESTDATIQVETETEVDTQTEISTETQTDTTQTDTDEAKLDTSDWTDETHSKNVDQNFDEVFSDTEVKRLDIVISSENWQSMIDDMTETYGDFGSSSTGTQIGGAPTDTVSQVGIPTNADLPTQDTQIGGQFGQQINLNTQNGIQTTTRAVEEEDDDPIFVPAEIYYNGIQWYKVGTRFKGNSSLQSSWQAGILKLSFKLDFDEYEDTYTEIKNQRFYGFKKLSLKNNYDDSSFIREKMASDIFKDAGLAVSHTAFYEVYVDHGDGAEYFGLYTLVEEVNSDVVDTQFTEGGNLYKPEDEDGSQFIENTFTQSAFEKKTNEDEEDWSDIESLFTALHDSTRTTEPSTWRTNLEAVFDVDTFLKYLAVNGAIQNWDTYGRMPHNYFLYNNPDNGLLTWIPWDNNEAFQDGKLGGALPLDFSTLTSDQWPLIEKIYADDTYKAKYDAYLQEVRDGSFKTTNTQTQYDIYSALVKESAINEIDGYSFLGANKETEFDSAVSELKSHVENRESEINSYLGQ